ncbi:sulfate permease [Cypionkella sp.]|uniref:SulP family inorganic anion transporter n=1 Tax=Cypionkella sp. TaxID=2811411 RepID=UPI002769893B|nr:sulfate permease [Cypionkella sp.]
MNFRPLLRYLPILDWGKTYSRASLSNDLVAALIVTIMLIPQSLAYAMLAGLPPEAGIYASILPIMLYAVFGTSRALAVGPVAVVSLMTAATIGKVAEAGTADYATAALTLALLSGLMLLALGVFRLGFIANFLSHTVVSGFITASGLLIAMSQMKSIFGVKAEGETLVQVLPSFLSHLGNTSLITLAIGGSATAFLFWVRRGGLKALLLARGWRGKSVEVASKAGPVAAVVVTTLLAWGFNLGEHGVSIVGSVPQQLPPLTLPSFSPKLIGDLLLPALLISIIGFVESISVAQTLAAKKRQRIVPDQELIGLGMANIGAAFTGGYPVTGGFARSVVNYDAGAETPAAGAFTAVGLAIAAVALTPLVYYLPKATLAATIIVAVLSLVDFSILTRAWAYSKADFAAVLVTILATLGFGVEIGVSGGVLISLLLFLYKTSRPHVAEVGLVPGTEHFRNINRHAVLTDPAVVTLRVDESLYFANARFLEDYMLNRVAANCPVRHVILMCGAVNEIDLSALEALEAINTRFISMGVGFHLSEVKGPVMDRMRGSELLAHLNGRVFLTQYQAWTALTKPA